MNFDELLHEKMRAFGADTYDRFLRSELLYHWTELVDESAQIVPVAVERGVLYVEVKSAALQDQFKFYREEILDAINDGFGRELITGIRIAQNYQAAPTLPAKEPEPESPLTAVTLTAEEVSYCEEQAARLQSEAMRRTMLATLISHAKSRKYKISQGWHECLLCESLCAPRETLCLPCQIKERERANEELYKIFYDKPELTAVEARQLISERIPYLSHPLDVIESARTTLIQRIASCVRYGDETSPEVKKLVALEKRLPPEELTPTIIRRALIELQYNLADQAQIQRHFINKKNAPSE